MNVKQNKTIGTYVDLVYRVERVVDSNGNVPSRCWAKKPAPDTSHFATKYSHGAKPTVDILVPAFPVGMVRMAQAVVLAIGPAATHGRARCDTAEGENGMLPEALKRTKKQSIEKSKLQTIIARLLAKKP